MATKKKSAKKKSAKRPARKRAAKKSAKKSTKKRSSGGAYAKAAVPALLGLGVGFALAKVTATA